jgi:integrase
MAQLSIRGPDGRRQKRRRRAGSRPEALRLLREMRAEVDKMGDVASPHRTVTESVEAWLEVRKAKEIQPGTRLIDQWAAQLITRGLGGHRLASLTVADCDAFLAAVARGDYGGAMGRPQIRRLRQKLIRVVENDERLGLVARNVARLSVLPDAPQTAAERRPARAIPADQIRDLIADAGGPVGVLIDLSGRNGLRPAEARALRWCNVDLDARTLRVDRQMNRGNELAPVKTGRSRRMIRFDARTADLLWDWYEEQQQDAAEAGDIWSGNPDDLVATTRVGTPLGQRNVHRSLKLACERLGIEPAISAYDLRHSAITLMIMNGHPVYRVADWAGTSERMIWEVYRHLLEDVTDLGSIDAADTIDEPRRRPARRNRHTGRELGL